MTRPCTTRSRPCSDKARTDFRTGVPIHAEPPPQFLLGGQPTVVGRQQRDPGGQNLFDLAPESDAVAAIDCCLARVTQFPFCNGASHTQV